MLIILRIPDLRFKAGNIVRITNTKNDRQRYVRIESYELDGTWERTSSGTNVTQRIVGGEYSDGSVRYAAYYHCRYEADSWTDSVDPVLLSGDVVCDIGDLEAVGNLVDADALDGAPSGVLGGSG